MSALGTVKNAAESLAGKIKEAAGRAASDKELERRGRKDQVTSDLKQAGEKSGMPSGTSRQRAPSGRRRGAGRGVLSAGLW